MVATNSDYGSTLQAPSGRPGRTARETISSQAAIHDADLVRRFRFGDEDAFVAIVARYRERMFSVAFGHLHNYADAEEIAQDTFIRAHRGLARFRGDSSLATWLHRIAFNLSRNRHKHNFSRRRHATLSLDCSYSDDNRETFADLIACDGPSPAREATSCEFSEIVAECMDRLGASQREILVLRNGQSQSYADIAETLGINIGTVKSRIGRAGRTCACSFRRRIPRGPPRPPAPAGSGPSAPRGTSPSPAPEGARMRRGAAPAHPSDDRDLDAALDDAPRDGVAREAGRIVDVQLVHQVLPVLLDRLDADVEPGRDLLVGLALGDQLDDLQFARSQTGRLLYHQPPSLLRLVVVVAQAL